MALATASAVPAMLMTEPLIQRRADAVRGAAAGFSVAEKRLIEEDVAAGLPDEPPPPYAPSNIEASADAARLYPAYPSAMLGTQPSLMSDTLGSGKNSSITAGLAWAQQLLEHMGGDSTRLVLLCLAWYAASAVANNVGKQLLNVFHYPVTMTWVQFAVSAIYGTLAARLLGLTQVQGLSPTVLRTVVPLCGFQICSQVLTSVASSRVPVSTVHTVKALSPLFTVLVYRWVYNARYSKRVYLALLPLTLGVMLACMAQMELQVVGLLCALGSCIVYVAQNIFSKRVLFRDTGDDVGNPRPQMDKLNLLIWSSVSAFVCLTPAWLVTEGSQLMTGNGEIDGHAYRVNDDAAPTHLILYYLFLNTTAHFFQALLAINVLASCTAVSYSIASLMKRVVVITAALLWFRQPVSVVQGFGILFTFFGLWLYDRTKSDVKRTERRAQRNTSFSAHGGAMLLPWTVKQV